MGLTQGRRHLGVEVGRDSEGSRILAASARRDYGFSQSGFAIGGQHAANQLGVAPDGKIIYGAPRCEDAEAWNVFGGAELGRGDRRVIGVQECEGEVCELTSVVYIMLPYLTMTGNLIVPVFWERYNEVDWPGYPRQGPWNCLGPNILNFFGIPIEIGLSVIWQNLPITITLERSGYMEELPNICNCRFSPTQWQFTIPDSAFRLFSRSYTMAWGQTLVVNPFQNVARWATGSRRVAGILFDLSYQHWEYQDSSLSIFTNSSAAALYTAIAGFPFSGWIEELTYSFLGSAGTTENWPANITVRFSPGFKWEIYRPPGGGPSDEYGRYVWNWQTVGIAEASFTLSGMADPTANVEYICRCFVEDWYNLQEQRIPAPPTLFQSEIPFSFAGLYT